MCLIGLMGLQTGWTSGWLVNVRVWLAFHWYTEKVAGKIGTFLESGMPQVSRPQWSS